MIQINVSIYHTHPNFNHLAHISNRAKGHPSSGTKGFTVELVLTQSATGDEISLRPRLMMIDDVKRENVVSQAEQSDESKGVLCEKGEKLTFCF